LDEQGSGYYYDRAFGDPKNAEQATEIFAREQIDKL